jgi:hypothetical protein
MDTTPKTRAELIDQVLDNLGVMVEGQAPTAEMRAKVDRLVDPHIASLRNREITFISDTGTPNPPSGGEFEQEVFLPIADSLAMRCAPSFNLAGDASLKALAILAEDELRVLARPQRTRRMLQVDKATRGDSFRAVGNFTRGT